MKVTVLVLYVNGIKNYTLYIIFICECIEMIVISSVCKVSVYQLLCSEDVLLFIVDRGTRSLKGKGNSVRSKLQIKDTFTLMHKNVMMNDRMNEQRIL